MVYLDRFLEGVFFDAKYATSDNFIGEPITGYYEKRVAGTVELADALQRVKAAACEYGYSILLWDGYRPVRAVQHFMQWAKEPENGKTKAVHYPNISKEDIIPNGYVAEKSSHSRGSTIDLTLCDISTGKPVDMDGIFDLMDVKSHHDRTDIRPEALKNRNLLREIMISCGFRPYQNEWWHYTLINEPYPDTYFDEPLDESLEK